MCYIVGLAQINLIHNKGIYNKILVHVYILRNVYILIDQ